MIKNRVNNNTSKIAKNPKSEQLLDCWIKPAIVLFYGLTSVFLISFSFSFNSIVNLFSEDYSELNIDDVKLHLLLLKESRQDFENQ